MTALEEKLQQAKAYLGDKYVLSDNYNFNKNKHHSHSHRQSTVLLQYLVSTGAIVKGRV